MTSGLKRCGWAASFLGVLSLVNGQWAVLQAVAWIGMLISYSAESGFEQGVIQTFDGDHPCQLCTIIEDEVTESDDQFVCSVSVERLLAIPLSVQTPLIHHSENTLFPPVTERFLSFIPDPPQTPPPIFRHA